MTHLCCPPCEQGQMRPYPMVTGYLRSSAFLDSKFRRPLLVQEIQPSSVLLLMTTSGTVALLKKRLTLTCSAPQCGLKTISVASCFVFYTAALTLKWRACHKDFERCK